MSKVVHRFLRQPNHSSHLWSRVGNRYDPFNNTYTALNDPQNNRKLHLIGTTNSSNTLAYRTKKLIQQLKPSSVYVQTCPSWWNVAKILNINSQSQFNSVKSFIPKQNYKFENHFRGILFRARYFIWIQTMKSLSRFPTDFNFFDAGLQTKFALHQAERAGSQIIYGGQQFDQLTVQALKIQPDMYPHTILWRARKLANWMSTLTNEYTDFYNILHTKGGQAFSQSLDRSRINFMVYLLNKVAPKQKQILIDSRDERIFRDIYEKCKGQNIVAVVNQWHMQGVETHWKISTGTMQKSQLLSPIADMDIDSYQEDALVNDWLRDYTSQITKSEPATHQNAQTNYHKQNFEYERTRHTHHYSHEDVPQPGYKKSRH